MGKGQEVDDKLGAIAAATEDLRPSDELTRATLDRVLAAEPVESSLLQLGDATRAIAPADTFTDAVMARILGSVADAPVGDDAFASIAARTAHLRPQDGFTDAIMAEVAPGGGQDVAIQVQTLDTGSSDEHDLASAPGAFLKRSAVDQDLCKRIVRLVPRVLLQEAENSGFPFHPRIAGGRRIENRQVDERRRDCGQVVARGGGAGVADHDRCGWAGQDEEHGAAFGPQLKRSEGRTVAIFNVQHQLATRTWCPRQGEGQPFTGQFVVEWNTGDFARGEGAFDDRALLPGAHGQPDRPAEGAVRCLL